MRDSRIYKRDKTFYSDGGKTFFFFFLENRVNKVLNVKRSLLDRAHHLTKTIFSHFNM
jgi:hypothetical protein